MLPHEQPETSREPASLLPALAAAARAACDSPSLRAVPERRPAEPAGARHVAPVLVQRAVGADALTPSPSAASPTHADFSPALLPGAVESLSALLSEHRLQQAGRLPPPAPPGKRARLPVPPGVPALVPLASLQACRRAAAPLAPPPLGSSSSTLPHVASLSASPLSLPALSLSLPPLALAPDTATTTAGATGAGTQGPAPHRRAPVPRSALGSTLLKVETEDGTATGSTTTTTTTGPTTATIGMGAGVPVAVSPAVSPGAGAEGAAPRKGPWLAAEDETLVYLVEKHGAHDWSFIAGHIPGRVGKQCRERYFNHLAPDVRKEAWTDAEDDAIVHAHHLVGNKWTQIAKSLQNGRSPNSVKNRWHSSLKNRLNERGGEGAVLAATGAATRGCRCACTACACSCAVACVAFGCACCSAGHCVRGPAPPPVPMLAPLSMPRSSTHHHYQHHQQHTRQQPARQEPLRQEPVRQEQAPLALAPLRVLSPAPPAPAAPDATRPHTGP